MNNPTDTEILDWLEHATYEIKWAELDASHTGFEFKVVKPVKMSEVLLGVQENGICRGKSRSIRDIFLYANGLKEPQLRQISHPYKYQ